MPHVYERKLHKEECICAGCKHRRGEVVVHPATCLCPRCAKITDSKRILIIVPKNVIARYEKLAKSTKRHTPDLYRQAMAFFLDALDAKVQKESEWKD